MGSAEGIEVAIEDHVMINVGNYLRSNITHEEFCALSVDTTNQFAIRAAKHTEEVMGKGYPHFAFIDYKDLPDAIWDVVVPDMMSNSVRFEEWEMERMRSVSTHYSKHFGKHM